MNTALPSVRAAGSVRFFTASEAARHLGRPLSQILKATRTLQIDGSRAGSARCAAIVLSESDLERIEDFLTK